MADKIVVLHDGVIEQVGSPLELYRDPDNIFVAGFIGSPKMNFIDGAEAAKHDAHTIGVRPEHLALNREAGNWKGTIGVAEHLGSDTFFHVAVEGAGLLTVRAQGEVDLDHGDSVYVSAEPDKIYRFAEDGKTIR